MAAVSNRGFTVFRFQHCKLANRRRTKIPADIHNSVQTAESTAEEGESAPSAAVAEKEHPAPAAVAEKIPQPALFAALSGNPEQTAAAAAGKPPQQQKQQRRREQGE